MKWAAVALSLLLLAVASQRLYAWPLPYCWELSVGSAEWGHWLALAALILGLLVPTTRPACFLTIAISLAPCLAAWKHGGFSWSRLVTGWGGSRRPTREIEVSPGLWMDVYVPEKPSPGVLVVHGGSWARGSRKDFQALNAYLREQGYFVASLDYRLAPAHPYPAACEDLDKAFDYVVSHAQDLQVDPQRLAWLGRSAGAHLALLQAYTRRPSRCVIAYYPPTDMLWSYEHPSNPRVLDSPAALRDFLGQTPPAPVYPEASPLQRVESGAPPTLLLHGERDDLVYVEQSRRLQRRLGELGVPCAALYLPWANHGCDINLAGPSGQLCTQEVVRFLATYL
ncbi:MAG: alpha/beta hydrolase [Candidatus Eremiobacteraeota bacterium]|nr:alpha/beta hydrolase [Candidatus Eremiobacteraeota bacterium]